MPEVFTVAGYWADSNERYAQHIPAETVHAAEDAMLTRAAAESGDFRIAGTLLGEHYRDDLYTAFIDPDDDANLERSDLEPPESAEAAGAIEEWTVLGLVTSTHDEAWNERTGGERYLGHEMALTARIAEDLARTRVSERPGLRLIVCAVLRGTKNRCESFPFARHDVAGRGKDGR